MGATGGSGIILCLELLVLLLEGVELALERPFLSLGVVFGF